MSPFEALNKYFTFEKYKPGQEEIITSILNGENVLAVLPTGAGKSICYQIPALISENFSIVISPLIALMKDQVDNLNHEEKIAAFINSTMSFRETEAVLQDISYGKIKLLYVAPERLENILFAERIKKLFPSYLFIDEAHCISQWGHNFRPSYSKIKEFVEFAAIKKVSAFTATATPEVITDIINQLGLIKPRIFIKGFERNNLYLNVIPGSKKFEKCVELISIYKTPAIVYTSSRRKAEEINEYLFLRKIKCACYHAGMFAEERKKIQESFINDEIDVIVATNAFGMGIDKKDIRLIIHFNTPGSIESYYQEIGRAGRDGKDSHIFLLHDDSDLTIQNYFISNSYPDKKFIQDVYNAVCDYGRVAIGNKNDKEIQLNSDFISSYTNRKISRGLLHSALKYLEESGYIKMLSEFDKRSTIQINYNKNDLRKFVDNVSDNILKEMILFLLREYGSKIFNNPVPFSYSDLAEIIELTNPEIDYYLNVMENLGVITYRRLSPNEAILLTAPRIDANRLTINYKKINDGYLYSRNKLDQMVEYVFTNDCRFRYILKYFGEDTEEYRCGKCDKCVIGETVPESVREYISEIILRTMRLLNGKTTQTALLKILKGRSRESTDAGLSTFGSCSNYDSEELKMILQELITNKIIIREGSVLRIRDGESLFIEDDIPVRPDYGYEKDLELFNLLREVRTKASLKFLQSAFLICPDEILREVANKKPLTKEEILNIDGFNNRMFNKVGEDFLNIINSLAEKDTGLSSTGDDPAKGKTELPSSLKETYILIKKGFSLSEISSMRKLSEAVVSMQAETIIEYEPDVDVRKLFGNTDLDKITEEIKKGITDLKKLKEKLSEVSFPLLRIAVAKYKSTFPLSSKYRHEQ